MIYVNENDRHAVHWLHSLPMRFDKIDSRSIKDVQPDDLAGFNECHFFTGIAGWPLALEMAGWPVGTSIWTGSCPCQPFSSAGKRKGTDDDRHLWPEFLRLITQCLPTTIFGEQVASKAGRAWFAAVRADLEALGYSVGCADLCAASVGAPHIRQRLFWVAYRVGDGWRAIGDNRREHDGHIATASCEDGMADGHSWRLQECTELNGQSLEHSADRDSRRSHSDGLSNGMGNSQCPRWKRGNSIDEFLPTESGRLANSINTGQQGRISRWKNQEWETEFRYAGCRSSTGGLGNSTSDDEWLSSISGVNGEGVEIGRSGSPWDDIEFIQCRDGKARPVKPGICPLVDGFPGRVAALRGLGNAIVPSLAAEFVKAFMEIIKQESNHK